jgi:hypothetical protein
MAAPKKEKSNVLKMLKIPELKISKIKFQLLGGVTDYGTPLIFNRQSEKMKRQMTLPDQRKNQQELEETLKHNPLEEYRASPYRNKKDTEPTLLHIPGGAFKRCIAQAAIDIPGASKAQIGRLVSLTSTQINVWGVPHLRVDMVRQAGQNKTPDVRFRCCLPEWACEVEYTYIASSLTVRSIANLLSGAGVITGVGDYRVEKGYGDFGKFSIVDPDNAEFLRVKAEGGRHTQKAALDIEPLYYDEEAEELVKWFDEAIKLRRHIPEEEFAAELAAEAVKHQVNVVNGSDANP